MMLTAVALIAGQTEHWPHSIQAVTIGRIHSARYAWVQYPENITAAGRKHAPQKSCYNQVNY